MSAGEPARPRPSRLVWEKPDGSRAEFALAPRPLIVGRDDEADIRVDEPLVSKAHARIEPRGGVYVVYDLGSTNLTRVNGEVVYERELRHGDEVRFARARCTFVEDAPER
ncbi:MAG TPA: FHA domain-containing protein [Vicinamibacteria bacterium]